MKLIKTIRDIDLVISTSPPESYEKREAARAIVFDKNKNIALLNVTKKYYHKLPGGGLENGENIETALQRECLEEIGCSVNNIRELGIIEEYRNKEALHQISYCFIADLIGDKGYPNFEQGELDDGFKPEWLNLEEAIITIENELDVENYEGKFITLRELTFLKAATQNNLL